MSSTTKTVQLMLVTTVKGQQVLTPVQVQLKGIATAAQAAQTPVTKLQDRLNSFSNIVSKSISNVRGTIVGLGTAMAVIGTFQMFQSSIQEAIEFEARMANVNSILKGSEVTIEQLTEQIRGMSGALGSSSEQADALYEALSAGVKPAEAINFVTESATLAKATLSDLGDTTRLLASIMNAYGKAAGSVTHVTDVLAAAIDEGIIRGDELANAFESVINVAAIAGVSFEEITAALATMTTVGISASEAGTALTRAITSYIDPSKEATKAVDEWNKAHKDAQINLSATGLQTRGLIGSLQDLVKATEGNIDKTRLFFGEQRALKGVLALTGEQMDAFVDRADRMTNATDVAINMLNKQQQSLKAQFATAVNNINKALDELWRNLIDKVTPAVVSFSKDFVAFVQGVQRGDFPAWVDTLAASFITLAAAIIAVKVTQLSFQLGDLLLLLPKVNAAVMGLNFAYLTQGFTSLGGVINAAVVNFGLFTTAALVAGSAILGWNVGKMIGDIDSLSDVLVLVIPPLGIFVKWLERLEAIKEAGRVRSINKAVEDLFVAGLNQLPENLEATESAVNQLFLTLAGHGITITQGKKSLSEWHTELLNAAKQLLNTRRELEAGTSDALKFEESVNVVGSAVSEMGDGAEKAVEQLAKLDRSLLDAQRDLQSKSERAGGNMFDDLLFAQEDFNAAYSALLKAQEAAHKNNNDVNRQLYSEAISQYEQTGSTLISATQRVNDAITDMTNPLEKVIKDMIAFKQAGVNATVVERAFANSFIDAVEQMMAFGIAIDSTTMAMYNQAVALKQTMDQEQKYLQMRKDTWSEAAINIRAHEAQLELQLQKTNEALKQQVQELEDLRVAAERADVLGKIFGMLSSRTTGGFSSILSAISEGLNAYSQVLSKLADNPDLTKAEKQARAVAGGIGAAMGALAAATEGAVSRILNAGSMLLMGFATGGVWGLALAAIVIGISAIIDSLETGADRARDAAQRLGFEISEGLAEQIHEAGKRLTSTANEVLVSLDLIANEVGITSVNVVQFIIGFTRALDEFQIGSAAMVEVTKDLNQLLPQMLESSTNGFGHLSNEMLAFIEKIQQAGIEVKALDDYLQGLFQNASAAMSNLITNFGEGITEWSTGVTDNIRKLIDASLPKAVQDEALAYLDKLIAKSLSVKQVIEKMQLKFPDLDLSSILGLHEFTKPLLQNRQDFHDFFTLIMAQINEMMAQGVSLAEVFTQLGPSINVLRDAAIELGLKGTPAFAALNRLFKIMKSEAAQDLADVNTLLTSFNNLGILNQQTFSTLENIFSKVYKEFNKDGKINKMEMQAMLPTLAQLRSLSQQYGFTLDEVTRKLIEEAIANGQLSESIPIDPMTRLADLFEDKVIPLLETFTNSLMALDGTQVNVGVNTAYTTTGVPPVFPPTVTNPKRQTVISAQGINFPYMHNVSQQQQLFMAHRGERVTIEPARQQQSMMAPTVSLEGLQVVVQVGNEEFDAHIIRVTDKKRRIPRGQLVQARRDAD